MQLSISKLSNVDLTISPSELAFTAHLPSFESSYINTFLGLHGSLANF